MRNALVLVGVAFAVTLGVVVGNRLSEEALAVVVGAICGITASIPVSFGLVIAASRNWGRPEPARSAPEPPRYVQASQPPVVVIAPPQPNPSAYGLTPGQSYYYQPNMPPPGAPRDFRIIGDE